MKVKYLRSQLKGSDTITTKLYSDKATDCQFLLIKVVNKEGPTSTKEEVAMAIQTPNDIDALISQLTLLKAKVKKPALVLTCSRCGTTAADVHEDIDPYQQEINNEEVFVTCCEACFEEKRRDI